VHSVLRLKLRQRQPELLSLSGRLTGRLALPVSETGTGRSPTPGPTRTRSRRLGGHGARVAPSAACKFRRRPHWPPAAAEPAAPRRWPLSTVAHSAGPSDQTRKSPIPVPPIPNLAGNRGFPPARGMTHYDRGGNPRRFPIQSSAKIGNQGIPISRFGRKSGNRGYSSHVRYSSHVSTNHDPGAKWCLLKMPLPLILEDADFTGRPPTHVSSCCQCQWLVASSVGQGPKSQIPVPRELPPIPDLAET
jgi:hypothetical protein